MIIMDFKKVLFQILGTAMGTRMTHSLFIGVENRPNL